MQVEKTAQGRVTLYDVETGERIERWPVDAKGMIAAGTHTTDPDAVKGKKAKARAAEEPDAPRAGELAELRFDPVKTPSMDVVGGATSLVSPLEPGERMLGASTDVVAAPSEQPREVEALPSLKEQTGEEEPAPVAPEKAVPLETGPLGARLPDTTPLGMRAEYATAKDVKGVDADQQPIRVTRGRKAK